ncbi:NAD(P)/FAD-dependent oxidoreductase [Pseudomonas sp.]|uniref:FAD/NAD(P)-dependent oxidoreductase n=1 Tax=Pseudomonas sp. TaxID=306 RepID=UPI0027300C7B|nr:NAD(P)/FAD-dependent oxidoreductase [Pseudomonas sp.]MDP2243388.1 NAD(P)/FAD-dependent oxidoreductase [Pseudomonas sp.]
MSERIYDLVVVGAGPAGMAAATTACQHGLDVALLDEQGAPGGQIYRSVSNPAPTDRQILGPDYYYGRSLVDALEHSVIDYFHSTMVWDISPERVLSVSVGGQSRTLRAAKILLATGAQERSVPFPGWTLPGVMTCGAAQILLKSSGLTPSGPLVLAGSGPLLLLIACQLHKAGVPISAVLDTTPPGNYLKALRHAVGALRGWRMLLKGLGYLASLRKAGIKMLSGVTQLRADASSSGRLAQLHFQHKGNDCVIECQTLLVHQGVVPNVQLTRALDAKHLWHEQQQCWHPQTDAWGETSIGGFFVAGDSAGIGGALAAEYFGRFTAWQVACQQGRIDSTERDRLARPAQQALDRLMVIRPFLDVLYQPAPEFLLPVDETIICRCEEVTAGDIRRFVGLGCSGPNQAKAFSRAGMGPCQGRMCGLTVAQIIAAERNVAIDQVGYYNIRAPIKPLSLGELASLVSPGEKQ